MLFDIARTPNTQLSNHYEDSGWVISMDRGWKQSSHGDSVCFHKGIQGNSCTIAVSDGGWTLETSDLRTFPIWTDEIEERVANCVPLHRRIHQFNTISYDQGLNIRYTEPEWYDRLERTLHLMDRTDALDTMCQWLVLRAEQLPDMPIKCAYTGGVDTAVIMSALKYAKRDFTVVNEITHTKQPNHEYIWSHNQQAGGTFWGYDQLADTQEPHIQATGFWGDEWLQRNPLYVHLYLQQWDRNITQEFDQAGKSYMLGFFNEGYREKIADLVPEPNPRKSMMQRMTNDFQMWHMDECLTWTPFCDREVLEISLTLDPDTVIDQCVNAGFSRNLIRRLGNEKMLDVLNVNKNNRIPK